MVLVNANAVEAHVGGVFELVEVLVVNLVAAYRVEQLAGDVHPDAAVLLAEVLRQVGVGHQVKPVEFHASLESEPWR